MLRSMPNPNSDRWIRNGYSSRVTPAPFDLNWRHLRAVVELVSRGRLTAAAAAVSLSQPALTQGLAKLERQLDVILFDRVADGMRPRPAGVALAERASSAFGHLAVAARSIGRSAAQGFSRPERLMTASQLRAFLALADARSFVAAAAAAGLSQPALHRAVRDLEQVCAVSLADRLGRGTELTAAGGRLARGIRLAQREVAAGISEARGSDETARLVVGAMPLCRALVLPHATAALIGALPGVTIDIVEGSWRELAASLADGRIDMMVGALREPAPAGFDQIALFVDRLVVIGRAGHPLALRSAPSLTELGRHGWIVGQPGTPLRAHWEALFAGGPTPAAPVECGSVMVTRGLLMRSDLLTLLSPDQVALELDTGLLVRVGPPLAGAERTIGVTMRHGWRPTALQATFINRLHDAVLGTRNRQIE